MFSVTKRPRPPTPPPAWLFLKDMRSHPAPPKTQTSQECPRSEGKGVKRRGPGGAGVGWVGESFCFQFLRKKKRRRRRKKKPLLVKVSEEKRNASGNVFSGFRSNKTVGTGKKKRRNRQKNNKKKPLVAGRRETFFWEEGEKKKGKSQRSWKVINSSPPTHKQQQQQTTTTRALGLLSTTRFIHVTAEGAGTKCDLRRSPR